MKRRVFLSSLSAAGAIPLLDNLNTQAASLSPPNILWIVSEDNNPYIGAYGDPVAQTPTLDQLAGDGVLYENCFSPAPVCAPTRFTLITGVYATSCGPAEHMRAQGKIPALLRGFPAYLRGAGYYCSNNAKTDYNAPIDMKDTWDESSKQAHWRKRPAGKPFFSVFNHEVTHESQVFPKNQAGYPPLAHPTDPAKVKLPAYHPDTPEMRSDRAHYYDQMARLDQQVASLLKQLEEDGLAEDTIVFYYGDNGGVLPRSKRFCYDSGLHVPLIVRFPKKYAHLAPSKPGSRISAPVGFVDFAPTILSLVGVTPPEHMQGKAFMGALKSEPKKYAFSFRNRMDERYDMVRTARDERYRYIRNFMPHLIYGQHVQYLWQQTGVGVWEKLYRQGKLVGAQKSFWEEKPFEELYDLKNDPDEINNLVHSPSHQEVLKPMRAALERHMLEVRDNGFIPEGSAGEGYLESRNAKNYPLERILQVANLVCLRDTANLPKLIRWMEDENECIRYWAVLGCVMLRGKAKLAEEALRKRLENDTPQVRIAAAEALCHLGREGKALPVLESLLLKHENPRVRLQAVNVLQNIGKKARPVLSSIEQATKDNDNYVVRAAGYTFAVLKGIPPPTEA